MTREHIAELFSYQLGLDFLLTLPGHYTEGLVHVFYSTVWIDSEHQFIRYMFKGSGSLPTYSVNNHFILWTFCSVRLKM